MEKRIDVFEILRNEGKLSKLEVYQSQEVLNDPYEKDYTKTNINPITIKALIINISFSALKWKFYGQLPTGSVQVIFEKKYTDMVRDADTIKYDSNTYGCWKDDAKKFAILERDDYTIAILERKV